MQKIHRLKRLVTILYSNTLNEKIISIRKLIGVGFRDHEESDTDLGSGFVVKW